MLTRFFRSSHTLSPTPYSPTPTVVGAAGNGIIGNGASMVHISGAAIAFTAFGALAALL